MDARKVDIYKACDAAIKAMNRDNVKAFGKLKLADWDEIHLIRTVTAVYRTSARRARQRYYEVAFEAYILAMLLCGETMEKAQEKAEKGITGAFVDQLLEDVDPVTGYSFQRETERKAQRLAEALEAKEDKNAEIDKALRYWSQQLGQYAINFTDYAVQQAFMDAGVAKAEWLTQRDGRVCLECHERDGMIYRIDEIPPKPHWGCRCRLRPVRE